MYNTIMKILTLENTSFDLDALPEEIDDLRFAIFDNADPSDPDYHFIPLIFLESFNSPALVLQIGDHRIKMPIDWQVLIGEPDVGDLEMLPLTSINDRGFKIFEYNYPYLRGEIACSKGTYIRSIANDLGEILNIGAYCHELRRTKIEYFNVCDSWSMSKFLELINK